MNHLIKVILILSIGFMFKSCSNSETTPEPTILDAPIALNVSIVDIGNNGDATDLEVSFTRANDESLISEYRVFIVPTEQSSFFNLASAENIQIENYIKLIPDGTNKKFTLSQNNKDIDGQAITESVEYLAIVLSITDGVNATGSNALSIPSNNLILKQTSIKITYIGNDGVYITDGQKAVIIDALPGNLTGWRGIANGVQNSIENGSGAFTNVSVAMITHNHGDHWESGSVNNFLSRNSNATLLAPSDVRPQISRQNQVNSASPALDNTIDVEIDGIKIRVIRIRHFNPQNGTDFANTTENFAYLIELGGKKILHIGDSDLSTINFNNLGLINEGIDVALIPTFTFSNQLTTDKRDVLLSSISPKNIIGLHLASGTTVATVKSIYPNAMVFTESLQFIEL